MTEHPTPPSASIFFVQPSERYTLSDCMSRVDSKALHCRAGLGADCTADKHRYCAFFKGSRSKRRLSRFSEPNSEHLRMKSQCQKRAEIQLSPVHPCTNLQKCSASVTSVIKMSSFITYIVWCLFQVVFHNVDALTEKLFPIVEAMQKHFSAGSGAYYSDAIFFLSVAMHRIMPAGEMCNLILPLLIGTGKAIAIFVLLFLILLCRCPHS